MKSLATRAMSYAVPAVGVTPIMLQSAFPQSRPSRALSLSSIQLARTALDSVLNLTCAHRLACLLAVLVVDAVGCALLLHAMQEGG